MADHGVGRHALARPLEVAELEHSLAQELDQVRMVPAATTDDLHSWLADPRWLCVTEAVLPNEGPGLVRGQRSEVQRRIEPPKTLRPLASQTADQRAELMELLEAKIQLYVDVNDRGLGDGWFRLNETDRRGEEVYPLALEALP